MKPVSDAESDRFHLFRTGLFLSIFLLSLLVAGCNLPGSASSKSEMSAEAHQSPELLTPEDTDSDSLESSIVLLRSPDNPEDVVGSAVIVSDDGYLISALSAADSPIEVMLASGSTVRPAIVTRDSDAGLAILKIPGEELTPVEFDAGELATGSEVFATGYDDATGTLGHMSGNVVAFEDDTGKFDFPIDGLFLIDTDIPLLDGFSGGALSDSDGAFNGILIPGESADGDQIFRAVSPWFVQAWLEHRQERLDRLAEQAGDWDTIDLPSGWKLRQPDGWHVNVTANNGDGYRADLLPADPDIPLQLTISVEENEYGTDASAFVTEMFESRSSAQIWDISERNGIPFARIAMSQEGALVDVTYSFDSEYLIAVSMTSSYQPGSDQAQVDEARALFETVVNSLHRP